VAGSPGHRPALAALAAVLAALAAWLPGLGRQSWVGTEDFRARIAAETVYAGDPLVPRYYGRPILTKPPLFYWASGSVQRAAGERSPRSARLLSLGALAATAGALAWAGTLWGGTSAGLLAAALHLLGANTWKNGANGEIDPLFALWILLALLLRQRPGTRAGLASGLCLGLAALTKGPASLAFGLPLLLAGCPGGRRAREILPVVGPWALLGLAWPLALRSLSGLEGAVRQDPGLALGWNREAVLDTLRYPFALLLAGAPGSLLALWRLRSSVRTPVEDRLLRVGALAFLLLMLAAGKSTRYLLPLFPLLALLGALRLESRGATRAFARGWGALLAAVALAASGFVLLGSEAPAGAALPAVILAAAALLLPRLPGRLGPAPALLLLVLAFRPTFPGTYVPLWEASGEDEARELGALLEAGRGLRSLAVARLETPRWIDPLVGAEGLPPTAPVVWFEERRQLRQALQEGLEVEAVLWPPGPSGTPLPGFERVFATRLGGKRLELWRKVGPK